ncbi:uncharacterized protein LOC126767962 isoform X2 [Bactrocera neohumeralis]|uniref:uncharacterized protein LOC120782227 isoform X2 n=1 Tax=Bactrocera tryoni TaxID=59916 RepID=UPI001A97444D|nr:uncharacterized protein LOC120782227 isoform X2 [Bactrocera tryoni]XP_050341753.1 uncharacterized protein LOC126767962 isoform X2 [Bactrocera neohumeralis]
MKDPDGTVNRIMDLCVASNVKVKEKRERQPNWTEAEKQLLLSLTRIHQVILENKGSDTMTIKKKSEAWDDIATNMRAAGYQRSKDRLKQQLGRIRAAEAKKVKDALAKSYVQESKHLVLPGCSSAQDATINVQNFHVMPPPIQEVAIKIEKAISLDDFETSSSDKQINKNENEYFSLADPISASMPINHGVIKRMYEDSQFINVTSSPMVKTGTGESKNQMQNMPTSHNGKYKCNCKSKRLRHIRLRINGHSPRTRSQRIRQLHLYRVAVERERLKMLRMQQKRDHIFYRKDKQIQNLKLQILHNLALNRINHINFS